MGNVSGAAKGRKLRILFVDDEQMVLDGLQNMLRKQRKHWDMDFATSGEIALAKLARHSFDTIVSDMRMPQMDGVTLLTTVRAKYPRLVRIVLSGHTDVKEVARALPVAHQFLGKPCEPHALVQTVTRAAGLMSLLHDEALLEVVNQVEALPPVPHLYLKLTEVLRQPDASVEDVARIIEGDVGMSSKVLQLVSSAFFGLPRRIVEIGHAVNYLGLELVRDLVLSFEVLKGYPDSQAPKGFSAERLHRHSLLTARLASTFVEGEALKQHALMAGLLHDVGQLVVAFELRNERERIIQAVKEQELLLHEAEKQVLGVTHGEIGGYLLGLWGLPLPVVEAITYHHFPSMVEHSSFELVDALHVADVLASVGGLDTDPSCPAPSLELDHLDRLGVGGELEKWQRQARELIKEVNIQPCAAESVAETLVVRSRMKPVASVESMQNGSGRTTRCASPEARAGQTPQKRGQGKPRVLCVDDDPDLLASLKPHLRRHFAVTTALGGQEALARLAESSFAVVMSDMKMPGMNGAELLAQARAIQPDATRLLLTGFADIESALAAVNEGGIFRFLTKPCPPPALLAALHDAANQHRLVRSERELLDKTLSGAVQALSEIVELLDPGASGLATDYAEMARSLAEAIGTAPWEVELALRLQRIGNVTLPSDVLERIRTNKGLSETERDLVERVPEVGCRLIANIPRLEGVGEIIHYQDKHYDGSGTPRDDIAGDDIPAGARILHVLQTLADARSRGVSDRITLARLKRDATHFDPKVVEALVLQRQPEPVRYDLELSVAEIQAGDRPVSDVKLNNGQLLLRRGAEITRPILVRLQQYAVLQRVPETLVIQRTV